jgi:tetratricopeptide (TPR) repeat protein
VTQKDKLLESAQKFIAKGQFDRAIKEYEQLLSIEPANLGIRQRIADLLVRSNRKEQAIEEYTTVARNYANGAHYLKAIAVYKQIQKLTPDNPEIALNLGSLNEKQGLTGNAIAEYASALKLFEKGGEAGKALGVLEAMLVVDPQNPQILLKYCEAAFRAGKSDEAYEQFSALALTLCKRNDTQALGSVRERVRTLFPNRPDLLLNVARRQQEAGDDRGGTVTLRDLLAREPGNQEAWLLLLEILGQGSDRTPYLHSCRECIDALPTLPTPRERLIRAAIDDGSWDSACTLLAEHGPTLRAADAADALAGLVEALFAKIPSDPALLARFTRTVESCGFPDLAERARQRAAEREEPAAVAEELPAGPADSKPTPLCPTEPELLAEPVAASEEPPAADWEVELDMSQIAGEEPSPLGSADALVEVEVELGELPEAPWDESEARLQSQQGIRGAEEDFAADLGETLAGELDDLSFDFDESDEAGGGQISAIRRGVDEQLGQDDAESHYSLGIAFKEMGLFDEAIAEFRVASKAPERKVDSLVLQGLCYREKGDTEKAMALLKTGMGIRGLSRDELLTLKYELALLHEGSGNSDEAVALFKEIAAVNSHFRETAQKLAALGGTGGNEGYVTLSLDDLDDDLT